MDILYHYISIIDILEGVDRSVPELCGAHVVVDITVRPCRLSCEDKIAFELGLFDT